MSETLIPITRFRDECDHATRDHDQRDVLTWDQLTAMLTNHARRVAKSGPGWAPVTFVDAPCTCGSPKCPRDRGHRVNENVIALHALTLDVDKTTAVKASERRHLDRADAEQALERLHWLGLRHAAHTTHSHAYPDHASFRVTIALSRSVSAEEWPRFYAAAMAYLDIPYDPASRNTARFWYLPSCKPDAAPIVVVHDGQPLDVEMVMGISRAAALATARTAAKKPAATRCYVAELGDFDIRGLMAERYAPVCAEPGRADVEAQWHIGLYCPWKDEHTSPYVPTSTTVFLGGQRRSTDCIHVVGEGSRLGISSFTRARATAERQVARVRRRSSWWVRALDRAHPGLVSERAGQCDACFDGVERGELAGSPDRQVDQRTLGASVRRREPGGDVRQHVSGLVGDPLRDHRGASQVTKAAER